MRGVFGLVSSAVPGRARENKAVAFYNPQAFSNVQEESLRLPTTAVQLDSIVLCAVCHRISRLPTAPRARTPTAILLQHHLPSRFPTSHLHRCSEAGPLTSVF
jgi:hypothetical protein